MLIKEFSVLMCCELTDRQLMSNCQIFPLYYYVEQEQSQGSLFDNSNENKFSENSGITDFILSPSLTTS